MAAVKSEKATTNRKELRELGRRIKQFRADNGMTAAVFAEKANLSHGPIAMLENGVSKLLQSGTRDKILKVIGGRPKPAATGSFACSEAGCEYVGKNERSLNIHATRAHRPRPAKEKETRPRQTAQEAITTLKNSEEGRAILAKIQGQVDSAFGRYPELPAAVDDAVQRCRDCDTTFAIPAEHVEWYKKKGLFLPARCQPCLDKRKQKRNKSEIDEALSLDTMSSATPPLKLSMGKMKITIEVD